MLLGDGVILILECSLYCRDKCTVFIESRDCLEGNLVWNIWAFFCISISKIENVKYPIIYTKKEDNRMLFEIWGIKFVCRAFECSNAKNIYLFHWYLFGFGHETLYDTFRYDLGMIYTFKIFIFHATVRPVRKKHRMRTR